MTKNGLVEFVRRSLIGREATADEQKTYHYQRVSQGVNYAFNTLLSQIPLDDAGKAKIASYYVKDYYNQDVKEANGYKYFGVSDSVVNIGEGRGIWYVQPSDDGTGIGGSPIPFSRRSNIAMIRSMAVGEVMNTTFWRFGNLGTAKQIVIEHVGNSPLKNIRKVDFGVVRSFNSYDDEEEVFIPDGRSDLLIQMVREWLQNGYVDNTNNNE